MKTIFPKLILLLSICFLFACGNNKSPYYEEILNSDKGQFRGVEIGSSIEQIKTLENQGFLIDEMLDYLHYDYEINMGNTYTVTYDFSEKNELYEIETAIFLDVIEDADLLFKNFSDLFNRKYGVGKTEADGYITWNTKSSISNSDISISMINDSQSYGFITIFVRDLSY
ncbi:MAG: hypothetical protein P8Q14_03340 [Vicingaceae bacterium]|nr:hypothetical protein [Vicingaceae bacterium]